MIARVKCWTSKFLTYSGRLQLIKSVLFEMQTYWAHIFLLPKKITTMGTTVCRTFLWTGSNNCSKTTLVAREKVCMPKAAGGLSVIDGHIWNKAALSKLLWALGQKKDKLWIVWVHTFYYDHPSWMRTFGAGQRSAAKASIHFVDGITEETINCGQSAEMENFDHLFY